MAELAINQIIKIILGILVFVIVVISATFAFQNYIKPYFAGITPSDESAVNLNDPFFKSLMKPENLVASVDSSAIIRFKNEPQNDYYELDKKLIQFRHQYRKNYGGGIDYDVGEIYTTSDGRNYARITVTDPYYIKGSLRALDGTIFVNNAFFKKP
jgi:hypothetical protein